MYAMQQVGVGYYSCYHVFLGSWEVGLMDDYGNILPVALIPRQVFHYLEIAH